MASATAESPTKLVIKLKQPDPAFLTYLGQAAGSQESPKAWKSPTASTVPVGSGPYVLDTKATVVGSSYVFTANPDYWDKAEQHYSKVVMNVYTTQTTILDAIEGGQVNAANTFDDTVSFVRDLDWLSDEDKSKIFEGNARRLYTLAKL